MLTFQFVPYSEIQSLNSEYRIKKLLKLVKAHNIVLLADFRTQAIMNVLSKQKFAKNIVYLTATPIFLDAVEIKIRLEDKQKQNIKYVIFSSSKIT
jgi:hypothetical protein